LIIRSHFVSIAYTLGDAAFDISGGSVASSLRWDR